VNLVHRSESLQSKVIGRRDLFINAIILFCFCPTPQSTERTKKRKAEKALQEYEFAADINAFVQQAEEEELRVECACSGKAAGKDFYISFLAS